MGTGMGMRVGMKQQERAGIEMLSFMKFRPSFAYIVAFCSEIMTTILCRMELARQFHTVLA